MNVQNNKNNINNDADDDEHKTLLIFGIHPTK